MASGVGSKIEATDYTAIQSSIATVLGKGSGTTAATATGYGITLQSSPTGIVSNTKITSAQWTNLRTDILAARQHQVGTGTTLVLTNPTTTTTITESDRAAYAAMAAAANLSGNRFLMGTGMSGTIDLQNQSGGSVGVRSTAWNGTISQTITMTFTPTDAQSAAGFTGADVARFFFNTGSYIRFSAGRWDDYPANTQTGALGTKNYSWNKLLSNMGYISFNYNGVSSSTSIGTVGSTAGYYPILQSLGTQYTVYTSALASSDLYSPNQYDIKATISNAGATITFVVEFADLSTGTSEIASGAGTPTPGQGNPLWAVDENVTGTLFNKVEAVYATNGGVAVTLPVIVSTTL
jgi:hypothetical protein